MKPPKYSVSLITALVYDTYIKFHQHKLVWFPTCTGIQINDNIVATLNTTVSIITGCKAPYCMQYRDRQTHVRHALRCHLKDKK